MTISIPVRCVGGREAPREEHGQRARAVDEHIGARDHRALARFHCVLDCHYLRNDAMICFKLVVVLVPTHLGVKQSVVAQQLAVVWRRGSTDVGEHVPRSQE